VESLLEEQKRYYRERAAEYDDWWFRRGRYALGPEDAARWDADVAEVEAALEAFAPGGDVLELAGGTGLWTRHLVRHARSLTVVDASAETLELNRRRVGNPAVEYVHADVFEWQAPRTYDVCFFSFWLSHVPEARFAEFWRLVRAALAPGGRVFLVDSGRGDGAHTSALNEGEELRRLADGREFRIVKRYFEPRELERRLAEVGFAAEARTTANGSFLYASCG
jgi:ubiquinone/menaquinone biosynthesis C-methylase UbiE